MCTLLYKYLASQSQAKQQAWKYITGEERNSVVVPVDWNEKY